MDIDTKVKLENSICSDAWYEVFYEELTKLWEIGNIESDQNKKDKIRKAYYEIIDLCEKYLLEEKLPLDNDKDLFFDSKRLSIDTLVIHHSGKPTETPLSKFEATQLLRLYVPKFLDKSKRHYRKKIFSGHFLNNKQTFIAYHYIIYPNGEIIQTLEDKYIGWYCGNWDYNCRSIVVCIHDDLKDKIPTKEAISAVNEIIRDYRPKEILGHREIKPMTDCPGDLFLGEKGWKRLLG